MLMSGRIIPTIREPPIPPSFDRQCLGAVLVHLGMLLKLAD